MNKIKLNETPVRTSRNFNINNIKLENVEVPSKINKFENLDILCETSKIDINANASDVQLVYGLSEKFTNQVNEMSNRKVRVEISSRTPKTAKLHFNFDQANDQLAENIEIIANEDTKSTIIIRYESDKDLACFHNGVVRVLAKKGAEVNVIVVNLLNTVSNHFLAIENIFEENAKVKYFMIDFGGKNSVINYYSNLLGDDSENVINAIYLGKESQVIDLNYIAELRGKKCGIEIEVQGALKDNAKKHFKGTIDFKKGCKKATGNENEACMLLSDTAKSIALPMLLCSEEDVEGNHSSSAGKIGEKELFYIMSRGFNFKESMKLMVKARFNKILENIKDEELKEQILCEIDRRLD